MPEITQDDTAMLDPGDFEKLNKHEREAFHDMQERAVQHLLKASNDFQRQFPHLHVEWRFQAEVYQSVQTKPATVRYSDRIY